MEPRAQPSDRTLDRRAFVRRVAALTAIGASASPVLGESGFLPASPSQGRREPELLPPPPFGAQEDPAALTIADAAALVRDGRLSPVDLVEAYLERIRRWDDVYLAYNTVLADDAREAAEAAALEVARGEWRGPLHGIPLALKDNFFTARVLTSANSYLYRDFVPEYDATAWARLREDGAVLLGKTQMGPLATSRATTPDGTYTTLNAWAPDTPDVSPGGSSSGSATAVAARMAAGATGTQTGGSITGPAGAQGLTGIKPTLGRVSLRGIVPLTYTRDHVGALARDARDAALLLESMAGPDPRDPRTLGLPPVPDLLSAAAPVRPGGRVALRWETTVGVFSDSPGAGGETLSTFEELGARVVELDRPPDWEVLTSRELNDVRLPERAEIFMDELRGDVRDFGVSLAPWINGLLLPGAEFLRGQRARILLLERIMEHVFTRCDVLLLDRPRSFDMVGLPLVSFPVGFEDGPSGAPLPVSALAGGLPYAEDRLLALVGAFQAVTDFHRRRPAEPSEVAPPDRPSLEMARPPWGAAPGDSAAAPGRGRGSGAGTHPPGFLGRGRAGIDEIMELGE